MSTSIRPLRPEDRGTLPDPPARAPEAMVEPTPADPSEPTERLRIIEFRWNGPSGIQPVLFLERTRLH